MNERPESKNSSSGYDDYGNRKISVESGHSFGSNERFNFLSLIILWYFLGMPTHI